MTATQKFTDHPGTEPGTFSCVTIPEWLFIAAVHAGWSCVGGNYTLTYYCAQHARRCTLSEKLFMDCGIHCTVGRRNALPTELMREVGGRTLIFIIIDHKTLISSPSSNIFYHRRSGRRSHVQFLDLDGHWICHSLSFINSNLVNDEEENIMLSPHNYLLILNITLVISWKMYTTRLFILIILWYYWW